MYKIIFYSFIFNILGIGSLFFIDSYISSSYSSIDIANWALIKSILFIGVFFVLLGIDQAIVRIQVDLSKIFVFLMVQIVIISLLLTIILGLFFKIKLIYFFILFIFFALTYIFYAENRMKLQYILSQFIFHSWKVILLFLVISNLLDNIHKSLLISLSIPIFIYIYQNKLLFINKIDFFEYKKTLATGIYYFFSLLSLSLLLYLDQIVLNYFNEKGSASNLFVYITFYITPFTIILGFLGFILTPYIRNNFNKRVLFFKKYFILYIIIGIIVMFLSYFSGYFLMLLLKKDFYIEKDITYILSLIVFLRYMYILPSSYIGSFATHRLIRSINIYYYIALVIYLSVFYILYNYLFWGAIPSILMASLSAWSIRVMIGYYGVFKVLKMEKNEL